MAGGNIRLKFTARIQSIMKNHFIPAVAAALLLVTALSSCETPAGQGAGFGAFSGAATGCADRCRRYRNRSRRGDRCRRGSCRWSSHRRGGRTRSGAILSPSSGRLSLRPPDRHAGLCLQSLFSAQHDRRSRRATGCVGQRSFDRRNFRQALTDRVRQDARIARDSVLRRA